MKSLKDLINESILDIDNGIQLQKPKFSFERKAKSKRQFGEVYGENGNVIGLYEFYEFSGSTSRGLILFVNRETMKQWYDADKHEAVGSGGPLAKDFIADQCVDQARKLFGANIGNNDVFVWQFGDYVVDIEGGAVPFEGEDFDQKVLNNWIKWLKFFNKTVKKLSKDSYDLIDDVSENTWKGYF